MGDEGLGDLRCFSLHDEIVSISDRNILEILEIPECDELVSNNFDFDAATDVQVHPNPVSDFLTIDVSENKSCSIILMDPIGRRILNTETKLVKHTKLDLRSLKPGTYFLWVEIDDALFTKKIVKL